MAERALETSRAESLWSTANRGAHETLLKILNDEGSSVSTSVALAFDPEVRRTRRDYLTATMKFHLVRGMAMEEIESIWQIQPQEKDDRLPLPNDRRRPDLVPGSGECLGATLQVRSFSRRNTDALDNEGFHVVVEHRTATWYEVDEEDRQRYALVVALEDQEREGVDLRALVEAQLAIEPEVEVEPRLRVRV